MRILIAEDDLTARNILAGVLKKWGYDVQAVKDGQAVWDILQQPDAQRLVILDWMMPGLDGLEVIRRLRALSTEQPPYVILLTSKDEKEDIIVGLETGANDYVKKPFDQGELFARVRVGQRSVELQTKLYETQQTLAHLAMHDPLTGILNRRAILEQLTKELSRAQRRSQGTGLSTPGALRCAVGFFDIDHFKQINDGYGHLAGDEVLKGVAGILISHLRSYDSLGRMGGDEFLVVAPEIDEEQSKHLFERLSTAISGCKILTAASEVSVTVSIGVAMAEPANELDIILESADAAMYQAKRAGANCVVFAG
jgi:two-component system cell cycle response regulator